MGSFGLTRGLRVQRKSQCQWSGLETAQKRQDPAFLVMGTQPEMPESQGRLLETLKH